MVDHVALAPVPTHSMLTSPGMSMTLPTSPLFAGDTFDGILAASLVGVNYGLRAWTVTLRIESEAVALHSYPRDSIWGDAQVAILYPRDQIVNT